MDTNLTMLRPNYFEIFTKVLNELSWREVASFNKIEKPEHKRILNLINITNADVLCSNIWDFQIEKKNVILSQGEQTILDNFSGRILSVVEGNKKYRFVHPSRISSSFNAQEIYSNTADKIITNPSKKERELTVTYVSNLYAINAEGKKIPKMEVQDDTSIIPMPYLEPILVWGTVIKVKSNPSFVKFGYWRSLYLSALTSLRSCGALSNEDYPQINIY